MTEIVAKIMVELISILAVAKQQIGRGRLSKQCLAVVVGDYLSLGTCRRELCKEVVGRQRDREDIEEIGPTHAGRGPHDRCSDLGHRSWSFGQCEGGHRR